MSDLYNSYKVLKNNEGQAVQTIPSYEVAKMMEKEHWEVLRMLEGSKDRKGVIQVLTDCHLKVNEYFIESTYQDKSGKINKCYECTKMGCDMLVTTLKNKDAFLFAEKLRDIFPDKTKSMIFINLEREEIEFIDQLEDALKPFDIKGQRQYRVLKYRIDYYIPSLQIAIEYDENNHSYYSYDSEEGRQKEIENELGCRFIRVSNDKSHSYNIGLVIKNIFSL